MAHVYKWENSLAVRLPEAIVEELDIKEGSDVTFRLEDGKIVMTPGTAEITLKELLSEAEGKENPHLEMDFFGEPMGKEFS
ncbi:hypothetical protein AAV35_014040 (plasmid) [Salimicrobium jeotgali]|uniref:SpoVT/AbrB domain-containing protein n=1 Tax=Salimicrobium jeotgali TaxID=1230341 RepID=K2G6T8_9BACI|nr:AbrB/MazE/SpoVT family DNA-binding domain-containing protein [Salimicrobium jeotgali]AKN01840.1 hypothetical protein AAV35_014040 [Salimicrobium jeotgali]EKE30908.1 SpoVT/AbrB domain-containing protein [Salimicrobium jeotgali]MBM7697598.1 antitoxin MazE [Salimicrobium jeotgali]